MKGKRYKWDSESTDINMSESHSDILIRDVRIYDHLLTRREMLSIQYRTNNRIYLLWLQFVDWINMKDFLGYGIIILSVVPFLVVRFMNIDATSARVLIDYWYLAALPFIGILIGGWILKR
jgi:hypothetical protein